MRLTDGVMTSEVADKSGTHRDTVPEDTVGPDTRRRMAATTDGGGDNNRLSPIC